MYSIRIQWKEVARLAEVGKWWMRVVTVNIVYPCYNGPRYSGSLAILGEPEAGRFHTRKSPLAIPDDHTILYRTEYRGLLTP